MRACCKLADTVGIEPVATNNTHYVDHADFFIHDLLTCIRSGITVQSIHPHRPFNGENHLKSARQIHHLFTFYPRAVENTLRIARECEPVYKQHSRHFPRYRHIPGGNATVFLRHLVQEGAQQRYGRITNQVQQRLEHELQVIEQMGYADYFLVVWDLVRFARSQGIRYAGRGSAADSLVSYCLFICEVDALERGLLFERFMRPERSQLPDIDIDFEAHHRHQVIEYIYHTYGADRVARVATYHTFMARSAIRDIGKVLGFNPQELDTITKTIPFTYADNIRKALQHLPELRESPLKESRFQLLLDVCEKIAGFPRFLGTHLGGIVISDGPLSDLTPLQYSASGTVITQFDKDDVEELGLVKLDLLSLRTLSAISDAGHYIADTNPSFDYDSIPLDDHNTYKMISQGETIGVFQLESPAQRALQTRLNSKSIEDVIASLALIRPGPIKGNMVDPYIRRHDGKEEITYLHPKLEPILGKTYGVILFQEQVIEIATSIAGFTPGEADQLRRVMTHARSQQVMDDIGRYFVKKAIENGIPKKIAHQIFASIAGYASYGFCEAHAAAFAATSYKTAYLLQHYPAEYYTALLNNQPLGYYPARVLCTEARQRGVKLLPVDVNYSEIDYQVNPPGCIRIGLKQVKGISASSLQSIITVLQQGFFTSGFDFINRVSIKQDELEKLIKCGALDSLYPNRRMLLRQLPIWLD
ncbi:DNA polymerase III subunit alpha [Syntrophomonas erecta subsp. sporosyntropha]